MNAVLTPHTGGSSAEALAAVGEIISTTTLSALRGEAVPNAVNLPAASLHAPELQRLTTAAGAAGRLLAVLEPEMPQTFRVRVRGRFRLTSPSTWWSPRSAKLAALDR